MTPINRHLVRETNCRIHSRGQARSIVIELDPAMPGLVGFRLKGTRTVYRLDIGWCYREALRCEIARKRMERKNRRKTK